MKELKYGKEVRNLIKVGVDAVANAVKVTLGPKGKLVLFEEPHQLPGTATDDGVTVARQIILKDSYSNLAAQKTIEVAMKTNEISGDGTTTATVLAQALIHEGMRNIESGINPTDMIEQMKTAADNVITQIKQVYSRPIKTNKDIEQIATISANSPEIGKIIAEIIDKTGKDGVVTVEEGKSRETDLEVVDGFKFDRGFMSPYFITDNLRNKVEFEDCYILVVNKSINAITELTSLLDQVLTNPKPILIIVDKMDSVVLQILVTNHLRGVIKCCVVQSPSYGDRRKEWLEDIAILTDGVVVASEKGIELKTLKTTQLGKANKVIIEKENCIIIGGSGSKDKISQRIEQIKSLKAETNSDYDKEKYEERIACLTGGIGVIYVGGNTESEMKTKKFKIEDALNAVKAAIEMGIVPGGGTPYYRIAESTSSQYPGHNIVINAIKAPFRQILENANRHPDVIWNFIKDKDNTYGYNAKTDKYADLIEDGVIDPTKTVISALENAISIASLLLRTECLIIKVEEKEDK